MATAEELRRLREEQSIFSALYDMARQQRSELAAQGRRPVFGGLLSKEPVYGTDTLRYEGIGDMLVGLLTPAAKAVDAPISAMRGTIPQEDMISEALGVGGLAMAGGGAVGVPRGAVGANALRVYHGGPKKISPEDVEMRFDPEGTPIGFSVTDNPDVAEYYRNMRGGGSISEFDIDLDKANIISETELYRFIDNLENKLDADASYEQIQRGLLDAGVDAIEYPDPEFGIRVVNPSILAANASKSAGLLTAASGRGPKKEELDPLGYQKPKMRGYLSDTDVQMSDTSENLPRQPMSWEDMEGKVVLPFYGDRTARGLLVEGVNDLKFDEPVYTEGGVDFMRGPAAQQDRAIWASNQNIIKRIESEAEKASRDFEGADIFGLTGSMSPDANDFATFTGAAMAELVKGAKITKKSAKEFDKVMRAIDPDFVGVLSPKLREWVTSTSSPKRKSFIRLMESAPMQEQGFPSPAEARYSVTDPTQRDMPAGMFGLGAAKVDTSAPLMYNEPKGNLPRANVPHSTYNTQIVGDYVGSLPPVPQGLLFRNVYDAMEGKTTKSGQALNEAHKTHAIKTIMPAQQITPEVLEGILDYLSRMER